MTRTPRTAWAVRAVAALILLSAVSLPYARAANGLQPTLVQFLQSFLYLSDHRTLAPILVALGVALTVTLLWPLTRPFAWATLGVGGLWGVLMLAIPLGYAHVRPVAGYWVSQSLLVILGALLLAGQRSGVTRGTASAGLD